MRRRSLLAGLPAVLVAGCGRAGEDRPAAPPTRALSTDEAERLALVRFTGYQRRTWTLLVDVPSAAAGDVRLDGLVDLRAHLGYARFSTAGRTDADATGLLQFGGAGVAFRPGAQPTLPQPPPADGWVVRPLQEAGATALDTTLRLVLDLGADRPENPLLLQQGGSRWLREDRVGDVGVDVLAGPAGADDRADLQYWVDADGVLRRLEARIGDATAWTVVDLAPSTAEVVPVAELAEVPAG